MKSEAVIVIRCNEKRCPCVPYTCKECRALRKALCGTAFEIIGEADEWK